MANLNRLGAPVTSKSEPSSYNLGIGVTTNNTNYQNSFESLVMIWLL